MSIYILLALINGVFIGTSRVLNGRLGVQSGPLKASLWNHVIGFLFLTLALTAVGGWTFDTSAPPPPSAYLGGFFGAFFVAVNSYVFPRLGAMNAVLLVISGQMITAVAMDYHHQHAAPAALRWLGVGVVLLGIYLTRLAGSPRKQGTP